MNLSIKFNYTVNEIKKIYQKIQIKHHLFIQNIKRLAKDNRLTPQILFDNYEYNLTSFDYIFEVISFLQFVSPKKEIREESIRFQNKFDRLFAPFFQNKEIYHIFQLLKEPCFYEHNKDRKRVIDKIFNIFYRNGVHLSNEKKKLLEKKRNKLLKSENLFQKNINDFSGKMSGTLDDFQGVNKSYLKKINKNKYQIGFSYPEEDEILRNCIVENTRKKYYYMYNNSAYPKNMNVLKNIIQLRAEIAHILGYKSTVESLLDNNRIATEKDINQLIKHLIPILKNKANKEYEKLLTFSQKKMIYDYDLVYWMSKYKKENMEIDMDEFQKHYPTEKTIRKIMNIYESLFNIHIQKIKPKYNQIWYSNVTLYKILDSKTHQCLGYLYLDLFPRDNKYNHAATFDLQGTYKLFPNNPSLKNKRVIPITAIVCNFTPNIGNKSSHLTHGEIKTFCHEMGHALHNLFSQVQYQSLSGTKTEIDFVESVSQLFENWCWDKNFLLKISSNKKNNSSKKLSDIIDKIIKNRYQFIHIHYLIQILYLSYDIEIHKKKTVSIKEIHNLWFDIGKKLLPFKLSSEYINPMCRFGHLIGYEVGYYSYLWSILYSYDIFSVFLKNGIYDKRTGIKLKEEIMEKGGSLSGIVLLENFLGRKFSSLAFEKILK